MIAPPTKSLNNMTQDKLIQLLYDTGSQESDESVPSSKPKPKAADQLTCMDQEEIMELLHHSIVDSSHLPLQHPESFGHQVTFNHRGTPWSDP